MQNAFKDMVARDMASRRAQGSPPPPTLRPYAARSKRLDLTITGPSTVSDGSPVVTDLQNINQFATQLDRIVILTRIIVANVVEPTPLLCIMLVDGDPRGAVQSVVTGSKGPVEFMSIIPGNTPATRQVQVHISVQTGFAGSCDVSPITCYLMGDAVWLI